MPRTKKEDIKLEKCPLCPESWKTRDMLIEHIRNTHGEEGIRLWRLQRARERRWYWDSLDTVTAVVGRVGSGKSLFSTAEILIFLARNNADLVISNMRFNTELLHNPEKWKSLCREYIESHYPERWKETIKQEYGHDKIKRMKRESLIEICNKSIDGYVSAVKPEQFVHIDTENTSSDAIIKIIEDKAKELGLVDQDGKLLIRVILLWDEAFSVLESRRSGTSIVIDLTQFALQARHYGCKIWVVSPIFEVVDVRYRSLTNRITQTHGLQSDQLVYSMAHMINGSIIGQPTHWYIKLISLIPAMQFYNTWEKPIVTLTELENKVKQEEEQIQTKEKQEFSCEICGKIVLGLTNFTTHKNSHTGQIMPSIKKEESEKLLEQVKLIKKMKPDATLTEIANILNRPLTTIHDVLARIKRQETDNTTMV